MNAAETGICFWLDVLMAWENMGNIWKHILHHIHVSHMCMCNCIYIYI